MTQYRVITAISEPARDPVSATLNADCHCPSPTWSSRQLLLECFQRRYRRAELPRVQELADVTGRAWAALVGGAGRRVNVGRFCAWRSLVLKGLEVPGRGWPSSPLNVPTPGSPVTMTTQRRHGPHKPAADPPATRPELLSPEGKPRPATRTRGHHPM